MPNLDINGFQADKVQSLFINKMSEIADSANSIGHQLWHISLLSLPMFLGCLIAGLVPLATNFSPRKIQICSIFGAGLLVGVALTIIIPEGVDTLFNKEIHHGDEHSSSKDQTIGLSLILGFLFMLLIDNFGGHTHSHDYEQIMESSQESRSSSPSQHTPGGSGNTITVGLIVHAAADGIALGAASATANSSLQVIVFFAIMLHKGPAAFGLTSVLIREGVARDRVRNNLFIFALAAPVGAILTILILELTDSSMADSDCPAIALLFSAGTFLYVATVHVLPDITHGGKLSKTDVAILIAGALAPFLISIPLGHGHTHAHGDHGEHSHG